MLMHTSLNVYLFLCLESQILWSLRKNTGYKDGEWSCISGKVEAGESATDAIIREAREEIGIILKLENLAICHVMHRKSDWESMEIFFRSSIWEGEINNMEPNKCGGLKFYHTNHTPKNSVDYVSHVLGCIKREELYSQFGW